MIPPDIQMMILQISRPQDRAGPELEVAEKGLLPITLYADGPERAYLIGAQPQDMQTVFAAAAERADGYGADRLALRMRLFSSLSDAINTQFKYQADEAEFPNAVLVMLVEALVQVGFTAPQHVRPCAVRYLRANLEMPDYEDAPPDDEAAGLAEGEEPPAAGADDAIHKA
jgi:hypothetical protein